MKPITVLLVLLPTTALAASGDAVYPKRTLVAFDLTNPEKSCVANEVKTLAPWALPSTFLSLSFRYGDTAHTCVKAAVESSESSAAYVLHDPVPGAVFSEDGAVATYVAQVGERCVAPALIAGILGCFASRELSTELVLFEWALSRPTTQGSATVTASDVWQIVTDTSTQHALDVNAGIARAHVGHVP